MGLYDVLDENEPIEFFGPRLTKAEAVSPAVRSVVTKLNNSLCVDPRTLRLCGIFRDDRSRRPASGT